jgi:deoxyribose-phosphate aldolase
MDASAAQFEQGVMKHNGKQSEQLQKQMEALYQNLRTVRHSINNNVAVIMAMAELTQRNPAQCQKLSQLCLEKAPQIAATIGGFTELFEGAVSLQEELDSQVPAPQDS